MRYFLSMMLVLLSFSCEYKSGFDSDEIDLNIPENINLWTHEGGISSSVSGTESYSKGVVYSLQLDNLLSGDTADFEGGTTGAWVGSVAGAGVSAPDVFAAEELPASSGNYKLHLKLSREPNAEYIYFPLVTASDYKSYIFRASYENLQNSHYFLSVGTAGSDMIYEDRSSFLNDSGVFRMEFDLLTAGAYEVRMGYADINHVATTFEMNLDDVGLFESSNHSVYTNKRIKNEGTYKFKVYAKKNSSSEMTLRVDGETKIFNLTDTWKEYEMKIKLREKKVAIEILPVTFYINDRKPGAIYVCSPRLIFYPEESYN